MLKYDLATGGREQVSVGSAAAGRASFVPKEHPAAEDDGYPMTFVDDAIVDAGEFVVYDAASMSDEPVATVRLPRVPVGFHGNWAPSTIAD